MVTDVSASSNGREEEIEEAAALLAELVAIRSLPGEERAVQDRVAQWFGDHGMPVATQEAAPNRPNVVAVIENGPGPVLLLNGHVDTASIDPRWDEALLLGRREGDRLVGLGAADMKAGVVAAMLATRALDRARERWSGTVIFSSVVDEEAFSIGAHALIESGVRADYCIVTESSWAQPALGSFGKYLVRVDVAGKAAHASWPERGVNAAVEAARFVAGLAEVPLGQHPRIHPSQCVLSLHSGPMIYESIVVPDQARILLNWHTVPGETADAVIARLQSLVDSLNSPATFSFAIDPPAYPAWETPVEAQLVQAFRRAYLAETGREPEFGYGGYGDMNLFSVNAGIETLMFGPLGANFHEAGEWVDLASIAGTVRVLVDVVEDLLPPA